ncbi:hypothetical protein COLO4_34592 [Corchorus olitorius]|uniref:Uncharacterized protein n=1 Tax=Corchorus olitorius TaxID=93759 RepID=A0A1R3GK64_9ROSI|nr:hypothetical protein COLO4_34592 [Corchorus olitorius]
MKEKENQTPRKEQPRSSDLANRQSKDFASKKIAQKSLIGSFASPVKDVLSEISEESCNFSSTSDADVNDETVENIVLVPYSSTSAPQETFTGSELTPCSKIGTVDGDQQVDFSETGSVEVEIVVDFLKQARKQALSSVDMDKKSMKVLDALISFIIDEFYTLPQERDKLPQVVLGNANVGYLCFWLSIIPILLFAFYFFYCSTVYRPFTGLPPT